MRAQFQQSGCCLLDVFSDLNKAGDRPFSDLNK
jgi:hypothetical protein